jgi:hypothetical protein
MPRVPFLPSGLARISLTQICEGDRLAIEYGPTSARIRGPISGYFTGSATSRWRCRWSPAAGELPIGRSSLSQ